MVVDDFFGEVERLPMTVLEEIQLRKIKRLVRHAYDNVGFYRRRFDAHGLRPEHIQSISDYTRLVPVTRKEDVMRDQERQLFGSRLGVAADDVRQIVTTGGTSGKGKEVHGLTQSDVETVALAHAWGSYASGLRVGDRVLNTLPIGLSAAGQWIPKSLALQGVTAINVGSYSTEARLAEMRRFRPRAIIGTTSYVGSLARQAERAGWDPRTLGVEILYTAGEPFTVETIERIERTWNARSYTWYGSTQRVTASSCELGSIPHGRLGTLHALPHLIHFEVIDPRTGVHVENDEFGEVVHTFLPPGASPLLRYAGGDRARYQKGGTCPCGRPFGGIQSGAISRYDDMMKIKGVNVWPATIDTIILNDDAVAEYQGALAHDAYRERAEIHVEFVPGVIAADRKGLLNDLADRLQEATGIRFVVSESGVELPRFTSDQSKPRRWRDERFDNSARR